MTLAAAIEAIQTVAIGLDGMKSAPNTPPESALAFPFAVTYDQSGSVSFQSAGFAYYFRLVATEIHVSRGLLGPGILQALAYSESFPAALMADPTLGGTVAEIRSVSYQFGGMKWGQIETIGYRFLIDIKMHITS